MVAGFFSRCSASGFGRRTHSVSEEKANNVRAPVPSHTPHGVHSALHFTPIEHPTEYHANDHPVRCPPPEPCIVHDGRMWKGRLQMVQMKGHNPPGGDEKRLPTDQRQEATLSENLVFSSLNVPEYTTFKILD